MKPLILCAVLPLTLLAGCSSVSDYVPKILTPYRPDIHQGNVVTSEMVENLHEGMTKNQVIFLLGTATLQSIFHKNEWSYVYYLNPRGGRVDGPQADHRLQRRQSSRELQVRSDAG